MKCKHCKGKGYIEWSSTIGPNNTPCGSGQYQCRDCVGTGDSDTVPMWECRVCYATALNDNDRSKQDNIGGIICQGGERGEDFYRHTWSKVGN